MLNVTLITKHQLWQNILENFLLLRCQAGRELDINPHDKVTSFTGFLRDCHSESWESFFVAGLGGTWLGYSNGFAVDGLYNSLPAGQGFFEVEFNGCNEIVALAFESRMLFL